MEQFLHFINLRSNTREGAEWKADIKDSLLQGKIL